MKRITVKVNGTNYGASISPAFYQKILEYMEKNHFKNRSEMLRKAIRNMLNDCHNVDVYMEKNFYSSKAELLREALRQLIFDKPRPISIPTKSVETGMNDKSWKKLQAKKAYEKKWNRLAIIPGCEKMHPFEGREFAIKGGITDFGNCLLEMKNVWIKFGIKRLE